MPFDTASSPVTPQAGSRLWTAGAAAGIAIAALVIASALSPASAPWLLGAAILVAVATWMLNRRPAPQATSQAGVTEGDPISLGPATPGDLGLLDGVFEGLADPVLVVSGGNVSDAILAEGVGAYRRSSS